MRKRGHLLAGLLVGGALALNACSSTPTETTSPAFAEFAQEKIEHAREEGVSEDQIAIMERAAERGEVTINDVQEALQLTYACLESQGTEYIVGDPIEKHGVTILSYSVKEPEHLAGLSDQHADYRAWLDMCDQCQFNYSAYVGLMYSSQPVSVAADNQWFEDFGKPALLSCLERNGVSIASDASRDEIEQTAINLLMPFDENGQLVPDAPLGPDCMYEAGY